MARAILTGELQRVKEGEYNGQPDVTLFVESGDDMVMVSVPDTFLAGLDELKALEGSEVRLPCLVQIMNGKTGPFMKWRMRGQVQAK